MAPGTTARKDPAFPQSGSGEFYASLEMTTIPPRGRLVATAGIEWHRVAYFLVGGALCLGAMLAMAHRMNPPDSALRFSDLARVFGPWEGSWEGQEVTYDARGRLLSTVNVKREYWSTTTNIQSVLIYREAEGAPTQSELWIQHSGKEEALTAKRTDSDTPAPPYQGRVENGRLFWTRQGPDGNDVVRSWIVGSTLYVEETWFPKDGVAGEPRFTSGVLHRVPATP